MIIIALQKMGICNENTRDNVSTSRFRNSGFDGFDILNIVYLVHKRHLYRKRV